MLKRLINVLRGSVRLEVTGAFPERLLNLCAQKGIQFWNVEWLEPTRLRLTVTRQGSGPARALGEKVQCTVTPAGRVGRGCPSSWPGSGGGTPCWWGWPCP